jgi:hypothetical protein
MAKDEVGNNARGTDTPAGRARDDDREAMERALRRKGKDAGLAGQIEENVNLTGSTAYETLPGQHHGEGRQHARKGQAQSPNELNHNEPPKKKEGHR